LIDWVTDWLEVFWVHVWLLLPAIKNVIVLCISAFASYPV